MSIQLSPEEVTAWDLYFSTAIQFTAPKVTSTDDAIDAAAELADRMLEARQQRFDAHKPRIRGS